MVRTLVGAAVAAGLGALVGAGGLALVAARSPGVRLGLDRPAPGVLSGVYGPERNGDLTFAWTGPRATIALEGLDRRVSWRCAARMRGARAAGITQPAVALSVDGVTAVSVTATNRFEDVSVDVPARAEDDGVVLALESTPTFVPGPGDRRELGVQVDEIACAPTSGATRPPLRALAVASISTAMFAAAFVVLGAPTWVAVVAGGAMAGVQAVALVTGPALYTDYLDRIPWLAAVIALGTAGLGVAVTSRGGTAHAASRFALGYSGVALYLLLLALLHPSKALVDAVFHAHRLEWVHAGRYFFTQPMPDGVAFPYAIALYVIASPWMAIARDHVALLRIVVSIAHVLTGLLLYAAVSRRLNDRTAGAIAVVLWSLVPQWFVVVGNANLTGAFAQSAATATLLAASWLALGPRDVAQAATLFALTSIAFLAHVGTFPLLLATMGLVALTWWCRGDRTERPAARWMAIVAVAAAVFSVVVYYGQFTEVYRSLDRVTGRRAVATASPGDGQPSASPERAGGSATTPPVPARARTAGALAVRAVGWPMALLFLVGAWRFSAIKSRDRLTSTVWAWGAACSVFVVASVVSPVDARFYRYTVEFIGRVVYATWPAVIIVAASGGAWLWRAGPLGRVATALAVGAAVWVGAGSWWSWIAS